MKQSTSLNQHINFKNPLFKNPLHNQSGALSLDFIFAMVLTTGMSAVLFVLCLTLSVTEVAQYIAFACSRNYFAADISQQNQISVAQNKFDQLMAIPVFSGLFKGQWFTLKYSQSTNFASTYNSQDDRDVFSGTQLRLSAPVLRIQVPFFSSGENADKEFQTTVNSYLGREVTTTECLQFEAKRWQEIRTILGNTILPTKATEPMVDNGC